MSEATNQLSNAVAPKRRIFDVGFILVAAILLLAAIGLNATVSKMQLSFRKQAVPLQKPGNKGIYLARLR
jgi:hypothetical protein